MAFKKALMTCAAVGALSVAMAASAFAANELTVSQDKTDDVENGKVSITAGLDGITGLLKGETCQMTVLVFEDGKDVDGDGLTAEEILYIDQLSSDTENLFQGMGIRNTVVKDGKLMAGTYTVLVGSDVDGAPVLSGTLTVSEDGKVLLGDVNGDTAVNTLDMIKMAKHIGEIEIITDETLLKNANVVSDDAINTLDLIKLAKYIGEMIDSLE